MSTTRPRGSPPGVYVAIAVAAIAVIALVVGNALRPSSQQSPPSTTSPSATATSSTSQPATTSSTPSANATASPTSSASAVRPDARHGLIVATGNMRTEDDPRGLQQPSLFMTAPTTTYAVSPDGKRIALIRTSQTGQQIVTFTTVRPNEITTVADLAGSGERATNIVWAGDGADYVVYSVDGGAPPTIAYSALRSVDLAAKKQSEIARDHERTPPRPSELALRHPPGWRSRAGNADQQPDRLLRHRRERPDQARGADRRLIDEDLCVARRPTRRPLVGHEPSLVAGGSTRRVERARGSAGGNTRSRRVPARVGRARCRPDRAWGPVRDLVALRHAPRRGDAGDGIRPLADRWHRGDRVAGT